jgi:hypothetical protein
MLDEACSSERAVGPDERVRSRGAGWEKEESQSLTRLASAVVPKWAGVVGTGRGGEPLGGSLVIGSLHSVMISNA